MQENGVQMKAKKRRRRRNENGILLGSIVLCLVTLTAITFCMILVFKYRAAQMETVEVMRELDELQDTYTQEEVDALLAKELEQAAGQVAQETQEAFLAELKAQMLSGEGAVNMLRYFYPDEIVLVDSSQYYFFPILDTLSHHTYVQENFTLTQENFLEYYEDGERISHKGIDVSRYQEQINWKKVAEDGVEYAFIRVGIRGYTEGEIMEDETFVDNIEGALENDVAAGVYFFTQAVSVEEAVEEASYVLEAIEPYDITYPVVLDVETIANKDARTTELTKEERTEYCIAFCETIRQAGYVPMIYGNLKTFMLMLDLEQLEDYDKWFAYYDTQMYYPYDFKVWQYTDTGAVDGIGTDVDINISFEDLSAK